MTRTRAIVLPAWAGKPVEAEHGGWPVVESFEPPEGDCGVGLTDLSHRPKAILQGPAVAQLGLSKPGQAVWNGQAMAGCLKPGQAIIFDLGGPVEPVWPDSWYSDMTEGWVLLGIWGPGFLLACDRSQAQNLFDACLRAGAQFDLKITGVKAFYEWFDRLAIAAGVDSSNRQ
jgi:hypothetical protein